MTDPDQCAFCDGTVEHQQTRVQFQFHGQTFSIDRVPAWVCTHCGEQYFDAPVYKRLEALASEGRTDGTYL